MNIACNTLHVALTQKNEEKKKNNKICQIFFKLSI
jgi:hypothetical protein